MLRALDFICYPNPKISVLIFCLFLKINVRPLKMYLVYSRLYSQGQATARLHYLSCNRTLDQPWKQNHRHIRKDPEASQTESSVLAFGWNSPNMKIFNCTYCVIFYVNVLTTKVTIQISFNVLIPIYKGICEQTKEIIFTQLKISLKHNQLFGGFEKAMKFNEHKATPVQMKEKFT